MWSVLLATALISQSAARDDAAPTTTAASVHATYGGSVPGTVGETDYDKLPDRYTDPSTGNVWIRLERGRTRWSPGRWRCESPKRGDEKATAKIGKPRGRDDLEARLDRLERVMDQLLVVMESVKPLIVKKKAADQ